VERGPVTISKGGKRKDRSHRTDTTDLTRGTRPRPRHASPPHSGRRRGSGPGHRRPRRAGGGDLSRDRRNCERIQQQLAAGAALARLAEHQCPARGGLDLGSTGKALAADLAAAEAMAAAGSGGVLVSLGADIAVAGEPPEAAGGCWRLSTPPCPRASCLDANIAATAAIVLGSRALPWLEANGLDARLVAIDRSVIRSGRWPADRPAEPVTVSQGGAGG
jgi:hypothetical protein